jgi:hypothetical protein
LDSALFSGSLVDQQFGLPLLRNTKTDDIKKKISKMDVSAKAYGNSVLNLKTICNNEDIARLEIFNEINQVAREFRLQNTMLETMEKIIAENKLINSAKRFMKDVKEEYGDVKIDLKIAGVDLNDIVEGLNKLPAIKNSVQSSLVRIKNTDKQADSLEDIMEMKNSLIKKHVNNAKKIEQAQASLEKLRSIST